MASGSDDQHLNIHTYLPESSVSHFALTTTVTTGHTGNIFSVKFMPHSNDATLVTCAGDCEVRVFDIEHSGRSAGTFTRPSRVSQGRGAKFDDIYNGVRYLSDGDTNARIYRSHADRVKRIVTESSPYLFLTCSEDGEVSATQHVNLSAMLKAKVRSVNSISGYHPQPILLLAVAVASFPIREFVMIPMFHHL